MNLLKVKDRSIQLTLMLIFLIIIIQPHGLAADQDFFKQVRARMKACITDKNSPHGFECQGEIIHGMKPIPMFYQGRDFAPVWFDINGLRPTVFALMRALRQTRQEGLQPEAYHLQSLETMLAAIKDTSFPPDLSEVNFWADFELILTDAFILLGSHLSGGRVNPQTLHADGIVGERSADMLQTLHTAVSEAEISNALTQLQPTHESYTGLRKALQRFHRIAARGGWPQLTHHTNLRLGDRAPQVLQVRHRLHISNDLKGYINEQQPDFFDKHVDLAVRRFQERHDLKQDGIVGPKTRAAMNVAVEQRIRQIELNLERWRWLPRNLGSRYIVINTADYTLQIVENGDTVLRMQVAIRQSVQRTPVFSALMTHMVINPYWSIPLTIAVEDILPQAVKDASYFNQHHIKILKGCSRETVEINPHDIDWTVYSENYFPFRLYQESGSRNPLGRVKFRFPNQFEVYLHDTPNHAIFDHYPHSFRSGSIRLEKAFELAVYLTKDNPRWHPDTLQKAIQQGKRQVIHILNSIPVHLLYMTAWTDENGILRFRNDIYKRDSALNAALTACSPSSVFASSVSNPE